MYEDIIVEAKIANPNRPHYEPLLGRVLKVGEIVKVKQNELTPTSRVKVLCKCDLCGKDFYRIRKDVKENTYCSNACRNELLKMNNPNKNIPKVKVKCEVCKVLFEVHPSKYKNQSYFLCSRNCYKKHRSNVYVGKNLYNYHDIKRECSEPSCSNQFKIAQHQLDKEKMFCSQECYWKYRKENYAEVYYIDNNRIETIPERKVREFLQENKIEFIQECRLDKYFMDFYLPEYDCGLEVYGDYWHANPNIYGFEEGKKKLHNQQIGKWEYDSTRKIKLEESIKKLIIIWEYDINNNFENRMGAVIKEILSLNP